MAPWAEDEIEWLRDCLAAGDTFSEIAEMANRTPEEVEAFCATIPDAIRKPKKHLSAPLRGFVGQLRIDEIRIRYLTERSSMADIGRAAGVSRQRIDQIVTVMGWKDQRNPLPFGWLVGLPVPPGWGKMQRRLAHPRHHRSAGRSSAQISMWEYDRRRALEGLAA